LIIFFDDGVSNASGINTNVPTTTFKSIDSSNDDDDATDDDDTDDFNAFPIMLTL
jgi:hypothetical protein